MPHIGIRSNNPTNLRPSKPPWLGQIGVNEKGFAIFDTMAHGYRAAALNLLAYQRKYGIETVEQVAHRWSTTDQDAYTAFLCTMLDCQKDDRFKFDATFLYWCLVGMTEMENSHDEAQLVTDADIDAGVEAALAA